MSAKTSYVIRLSEDLYLDSNNNFLPSALPNLPVYALAGGDLPLSDDTARPYSAKYSPYCPKTTRGGRPFCARLGLGRN